MSNYENYTPEIPYTDDLPTTDTLKEEKERRNAAANAKTVSKKKDTRKTAQKKQTPPAENKKQKPVFAKIKETLTGPSARILVGIMLGCLCVYLGVAFISYFTTCIHDQSQINTTPIGQAAEISNSAGEGGARLAEFLINECFGLGSFVIVLWFGAMSLKMLVGYPRFKTINFTIKCIVALITVSLIIGLITITAHTAVNWGGYHGRYVNEFIIKFIGGIGAVLLCIFMIALFVVICLRDLVNWIIAKKRKYDEKKRKEAERRAALIAREEELRLMKEQEKMDDLRAGETVDMDTTDFNGQVNDTDERLSFESDEPIYTVDERTSSDSIDNTINNTAAGKTPDPESGTREESAEATLSPDTVEATEADDKMVVNVNQIGDSGLKHYTPGNTPADNHPYKFPPFDILRPGKERISVDTEEQLENKEKIRSTLLDFGIPITRISATVGPTVTLYEIVPDKGVKIAKIRNLVDDIALSLSATGVRIIAPIPGKGTVGIEVANKDPQMVSMRTVLQSKKFQDCHYILPLAIGSTISNEVYIADLAKMPHLLVAGATGQGKSVGLNAMIASLLYCKRPNELKFVMIDPKQVEFSLYNKIKEHYMAVIPSEVDDEPVITDIQKVEATLNSLVIEMEQRYSLLKNQARNIEEYNAKYKEGKLNPLEGHRFLPYIVVIVDEFGDLVMQLKKNVEVPIARLGQKARAVGIHVIIATQRPSTDVITGIIKANFPARVSFKVSQGVDSKTILDATGAQQLIGRGDMLIFNNSEMIRVQCAFIDTPEVKEICDYVGRQPYPSGPYILPEPVMGDNDSDQYGNTAQGMERDQLFEEVARLVVNSNTASTSSLQRRYSIGYNRAGKIMDQLEAAGIVGPSQGGRPRAVLVDLIGLENILSALD